MATVETSKGIVQTSSVEHELKWNELVAPAPMGIAVMSQLLICSSRVRDFEIHKIDKKHLFPLMKHPDSFRTTLVQIANESYNAFMKAHSNMERIQMKMDQAPDHIRDCIKYMQSGKQVVIEKLLPLSLKRITEIATGGQELSEEVCNAFKLLGDLIQQVLEATTHSMGDKEQKITAMIEEAKKSEEKVQKEKQEKLQKEIESAKNYVKQKQEYLDETRGSKWDFWLQKIGHEPKWKSLEHAKEMKEEAERQLQQTKEEAKVRAREIDQTSKENIEKLEKMRVDVNNDAVSPNETIATLRVGLKHLTELQTQWSGIGRHFDTIKNHLSEKTSTNLQDFIAKSNFVAKEGTELFDLAMPKSIEKSLESTFQTHHSAKMYVNVSNNYIMKSLTTMHGMIALPSNEVVESQKKLIDSCQEASNGIMRMYNEDMNNTIREMEVLANKQNS